MWSHAFLSETLPGGVAARFFLASGGLSMSMIDNHSHLRLTGNICITAGVVPHMYVCLCNAVTDRKIREAVGEGCCSMRDLQTTLGVAARCGKCASSARDVLVDALHEKAAHVQTSNVTPIRNRTAA